MDPQGGPTPKIPFRVLDREATGYIRISSLFSREMETLEPDIYREGFVKKIPAR
jgi:hypothetical protein